MLNLIWNGRHYVLFIQSKDRKQLRSWGFVQHSGILYCYVTASVIAQLHPVGFVEAEFEKFHAKDTFFAQPDLKIAKHDFNIIVVANAQRTTNVLIFCNGVGENHRDI